MNGELPVKSFASQATFETWFEKNHASSPGLWVRFFKKAASKKSLTHSEALDVALCYGLHKFTPRGARSVWSKRNREHVERLTKEGRMQPAGLAAVAAAKQDGRWDKAYDSRSARQGRKSEGVFRYREPGEPPRYRLAIADG